MDENIKSSYYSILPAVVRYDKDLTDKAKLLYSEITCLCNKEGFASMGVGVKSIPIPSQNPHGILPEPPHILQFIRTILAFLGYVHMRKE